MAKIMNPADIFPEITGDYRRIFDSDLVSIILYGSAAGSDYRPGRSDINLLIIVSERAIENLETVIPIVSRWKKRRVAVPLFMTKHYITSSLDAYPLEFLTMSRKYTVVNGEDVLAGLAFDRGNLRLQCEREIKGKLLLLRRDFLDAEGKPKMVRQLIAASITAFVSIMSGLLYLKGLDEPGTRRERVMRAAEQFSFNPKVFLDCLDMKDEVRKYSPEETLEIFKRYLAEIHKLWESVDAMNA